MMEMETDEDDHKDHHIDSSKKKHEHKFDADAEEMIKTVKHAMENGEGCRIFGGASNVNVSHVIHDLSFGPKYPGIHNPLDGTTRILQDASGTFKYYIKANDAYYKLSNTRAQIQAYVFDVIRASVPKLNLDDTLAQENDIAKAVKEELKKSLSAYGYEIVQTLIVDIEPDERVKRIE
ncbi:uncharacterized protein A4U43_C07F34710 [Asparagus officinalis]|uniref:Band 7 domain-containing protein n=1 Tax=Asparagus officinalis TaxID=4686 RepID=A0A5P1EMC9_ASPOF|nr:uncharacterized protein A4U43_C07F34710 [Asparagus officinalis]